MILVPPAPRLARDVVNAVVFGLVGGLVSPLLAEAGQARSRHNALHAMAEDARNARDRREAAEMFARGSAGHLRSGSHRQPGGL